MSKKEVSYLLIQEDVEEALAYYIKGKISFKELNYFFNSKNEVLDCLKGQIFDYANYARDAILSNISNWDILTNFLQNEPDLYSYRVVELLPAVFMEQANKFLLWLYDSKARFSENELMQDFLKFSNSNNSKVTNTVYFDFKYHPQKQLYKNLEKLVERELSDAVNKYVEYIEDDIILDNIAFI